MLSLPLSVLLPLLRSTRVVPSSCWRSNASRVRTRSTPGNSRDDFLDDVGETCWVKRDDCAYTGDAGSKSWLAGGVCVGVPGRSSEILRADATPSSARDGSLLGIVFESPRIPASIEEVHRGWQPGWVG